MQEMKKIQAGIDLEKSAEFAEKVSGNNDSKFSGSEISESFKRLEFWKLMLI